VVSLQQSAALILAAIGVVFMLISAIGLLRLPDVFSRMHAAGNASTIGVGCLLLAAGVHFWQENLLFRMILLIGLIFATAPISTAAMARAAYKTGTVKGMRLQIDEMGHKEVGSPETAPVQTGNP
jgi:multicomponent Na+:H+ antiporter subunit G